VAWPPDVPRCQSDVDIGCYLQVQRKDAAHLIRTLVHERQHQPKARTEEYESKGKALYTAAGDGNLDEVRRLLQEGADTSYFKEVGGGLDPLYPGCTLSHVALNTLGQTSSRVMLQQ
jgi:hypothetical protein